MECVFCSTTTYPDLPDGCAVIRGHNSATQYHDVCGDEDCVYQLGVIINEVQEELNPLFFELDKHLGALVHRRLQAKKENPCTK